MTTKRRARGLSLGSRLFLASALLVVIAVGAAVLVTFLAGQRIAGEAAGESLARSTSVQSALAEERRLQLLLMAELLARNPDIAAYLIEAIAADDVPSILDQLEERRSEYGFDFAVALAPDGRGIAGTNRPLAAPWSANEEQLFQQIAEDFGAEGVWNRGGQLFDTVAVPVEKAGAIQGFLVIGFAIDEATALDLRQLGSAEVAFIADSEEGPPSLVAGTLEPRLSDELQALLQDWTEGSGLPTDQVAVTLAEQQWLLQTRPLPAIAGQTAGNVLSLASLERQLAPYRRIMLVLGAVGLGTILLALLISSLLPRGVLAPVRQLVQAVRAAASGDYEQRLAEDRGDEVGELAGAFNTLLSELREKRDMEVYVNELNRNLPAASASPTLASTQRESRSLRAVVMGVESRTDSGNAASSHALEPHDRELREAVKRYGGKVEASAGHRSLAVFSESQAVARALAAAGQVAGDGRAVALAQGPITTGEAVAEGRSQVWLTGSPVRQVESVLREIKGQTVALTGSLVLEISDTAKQGGLALNPRTGPISQLEVVLLRAEAASTLGRAGGATESTAAVAETSRHTVTPGQLLGRRFEILSTLGTGGMGVVLQARDLELDELVALKMLKQPAFTDPELLQRLKSELKLARKISHPNVVRTYDFGDIDGIPFISMEYVRGITLRELLSRSGRLPLSVGLRLARQLCRGLVAAHAEGVLHRDIKPENLILEANGNAKLMDFGIARPLQSGELRQTRPGALMGTPLYLAPEQIQGQEPDTRADLYASGVVLYEIFTGQLPFSTQGSLMQVLARRMEERPTPPQEHWPEMPSPLIDIILRCLELEREKRYPEVGALLKELEVLRG